MTSYALYRMPHSKQATLVAQLTGEPEQLSSCRELSVTLLLPNDIS